MTMTNSESVSKYLSGLRIAVLVAVATVVGAGLAAPNVLAAKGVKTTVRLQDSKPTGNSQLQVSGNLGSKQGSCLANRAMNLFRTDAAGNIVEGPIGSDKSAGKKGAWQIKGQTAATITAADRFVVVAKKRMVKTTTGKVLCKKGTTAPFGSSFSSGPGQGPGQGGSNHLPSFPSQTTRVTQHNSYSIVLGQPCLTSQSLDITISPGATDPDGDPLTYSWTASNGTINGSGLSATWQRVVQNCSPVSGTVTITASDGKGGTAQIQRSFN